MRGSLPRAIRCFYNYRVNLLGKSPVHNLEPFKITCSYSNISLTRNFSRRPVKGTEDTDVIYMIGVLASAYTKQDCVYSDNVVYVLDNVTPQLLKEDRNYGLLLLQCCGRIIADEPPQARALLCNKFWKKLKESGCALQTKHYNVYIRICTENKAKLDAQKFLAEMESFPNEETYQLLLDNVCEVGDMQQAMTVVAEMKSKGIPADEKFFNALALGHTINGGLGNAEEVLAEMKAVHIPASSATWFSILLGLACRNNSKEFLKTLHNFPGSLDEKKFVLLLMQLSLHGNYMWLDEMLAVVEPDKLPKLTSKQLDLLYINLIRAGQPETAFAYYRKFTEVDMVNEGEYAGTLLLQMIQNSTPTKVLMGIIKVLHDTGLNVYALEKLTEVVLKEGPTEKAWVLLENMPTLRPHYFWPLFIKSAQEQGQIGVLNTIKKMLELNVKPDMDTLEFYCLPFCDLDDSLLYMVQLQKFGFTVRELLTPFLCFLLKKHRMTLAKKLCQQHANVLVHADRVIPPLVKAWADSSNSETAVAVLEKITKTAVKSADYSGQFVMRALRSCKTPSGHHQLLRILEMMHAAKLQISSSVADSVKYWMRQPKHQCDINLKILDVINNLVNESAIQNGLHIPHPRDMTVTELEHHLIELESKGMQTRGVLRRLIQAHAQAGNRQRVSELQQKFVEKGYSETAGMKSTLFYSYVKSNNIDSAMDVYYQIKKNYPNFVLDDFKILDLSLLLVKNNQFNTAIDILINETTKRKAQGGPGVMQNCQKLIAVTNNTTQAEELLKVLVDRGYCVPCNIILGSVIKIYLNEANLQKTVQRYVEFTNEYSCTPLQLQLMNAVIQSEKEELLAEVMNATSNVHGSEAAISLLITALAENGLKKSLQKFLCEIRTIPRNAIEKRCERWVSENKLNPLETLAAVASELPSGMLDKAMLYHFIMQIHNHNNDCESALKFYRQLLQTEKVVPQKVVDLFLGLINRCKYKIPEMGQANSSS